MERRTFISAAVAGGVAASLSSCGPESSGAAAAGGGAPRKKVKWDLASSFPPALDTIHGAAKVMAERVEQLTEGGFKIDVKVPGEIAAGNKVFDVVRGGGVQMGHTASYYYIGVNEALAFDTSIPFGLNARQHQAWLHKAGGMELLRELFAKYNIINLAGGNTGTQMGGWFKKEIKSLADLKGLKMRIPGMGGQIMKDLGVNVQNIPGGDVFPALETGSIDAAEWVGPYDDLKLGFNKVAKFYYYPGWWEPGPALSFYIHQGSWDKLPVFYRNALEVACAEASAGMMQEYDAKNPKAFAELKDNGVELRRYPEDLLVAAKAKMDERTTTLVADNPDFAKIHKHWDAFRQASNAWFSTAELGLASFMAKK